MSIIQSLPCPACQENGHDRRGNHLMVFEDGARFCGKAEYHKTGKPLFVASDGSDPALDTEINGQIKYTPAQFTELLKAGKLDDPKMRAIALSGMRGEDQWEVMDDEERAAQQERWDADKSFYDDLKVKNLIDRHIHGKYAKLYGIKVGHDEAGVINRHYYPVYEGGKWVGAKCRNLPKDFRFGHLGRMWGAVDLFGMHTTQQVMDSGARMNKLLIVGGECDAAAAQQMLCESQKGTKYENQLFHVWSVTKGEASVEQLIQNREYINKFREVIFAFDDDDTGRALVRECSRLFPGKALTMTFPKGAKDPNDCLKKGMSREFVDAWFNPTQAGAGSKVKSIRSLAAKAKVQPQMGKSWPWPSMNRITMGIRKHQLYLFGAGSGVGKTATTKEIVQHLIEEHAESVGVIYTEEPASTTVRSYAGKWIDKRIELPPTNDIKHPDYDVSRDYTEAQANKAIDDLEAKNLLFVVDLAGDTDIDTIMAACEEMIAMGIQNIVIDNLTGITLSKDMNKVEAIDEAMKRIGNFKDEKPVSIFLYSHLTKPGMGRVPHEEGGEVLLNDFRGSGAIKFWANYAFGIRRNTRADDIEEKCMTYIECLKDRDLGIMTGEVVALRGDLETGRLKQPMHRALERKPAEAEATENTPPWDEQGEF